MNFSVYCTFCSGKKVTAQDKKKIYIYNIFIFKTKDAIFNLLRLLFTDISY